MRPNLPIFFFFIYIKKMYVFLKKLQSLFLAVLGLPHFVGLSLAVLSRGYLYLWYAGFSLLKVCVVWLLLLQSMGAGASVVGVLGSRAH